MDFVVGGLAGVGAGFFSNPFDVVKTRMQLQGELRAKGQHAVHYKNIPHAMYTIVKHDGISALQKGLVPALWFQLFVNGVRLGVYQQADNYGMLRNEKGDTKFANSLFFGAVAGMMGGFFGSPLQLVKTQLMSYSSDKIAVGTQHGHSGFIYAIRKIIKKSGVMGLWRGFHGMMIRNGIGSASQIASFTVSKEWMNENNLFQNSKYMSSFVASNIGAFVKTVFLTPMDVIMTRLYNQGVDASGRGDLYSGIVDCARKMTKTEGIFALYKGVGPSYLRVDARGRGVLYYGVLDCASKIIRTEGMAAFYKGVGPTYFRQAPHSVFLLVFWDILKDIQKSLQAKTL